MWDLPDLPLALIMEEILEWEKPAERDTNTERERDNDKQAKER